MGWGRRNRLRALQELALGLSGEGRVEDALATVEEADARLRATRRPPRGADADLLHLRAFILCDAGRWTESEAAAREAIAVRRALGALDTDQRGRLADSLELLANVLTRAHRLDEALALVEEVSAMRADMPWPAQARALLNRSVTLLEAGREEEGLRAARDLVAGSVARAGQSGIADPTFAHGLVNLGLLLRHNGRWGEALAVQHQAVTELRALAASRDNEDVANLARALSNQALMHLECGRPEEAVAPGEEALALREELAAVSMAAFGPELSDGLNNHAVLLHHLDRHEEAVPVARRCVDLRRVLHAAEPHAYERKLANALATCAEELTRCGRGGEAVEVGRESVERLEALEAAEPGLHTLWLAGSLDTLAGALACSGEESEALTTSRAATTRARASYAAHGAGVGDRLAQILLAVADRHAVDHPVQARDWAHEALELLRALAADEPEAHAAALARAEELVTEIGGG